MRYYLLQISVPYKSQINVLVLCLNIIIKTCFQNNNKTHLIFYVNFVIFLIKLCKIECIFASDFESICAISMNVIPVQ